MVVQPTRFAKFTALLWLTCSVYVNGLDTDECKRSGFHPYHLSCSTCSILPDRLVQQCQSCCFPYKTLEKRTQRYQAALIGHPRDSMSYYPEIDNLVKEDWEDLVNQKGADHLFFKDTSREPQPSVLLWFHEVPETSMSLEELKEQASETVFLQGWKRDDVREMLKAILPDEQDRE